MSFSPPSTLPSPAPGDGAPHRGRGRFASLAAAGLLLPLLTAPMSLPAQPSLDQLRARLLERLARHPGASVAVFYRRLGREQTLAINADSPFHAASTMKLPVMIEYFRALESGRIPAHATHRLVNRFASIVDGSPYALDAADDSDSALYRREGEAVPVRELVERMITRSSNLATNAVIELVGADRAQASARALGADSIVVRRGVEDGKAFRAGLNNTTTARDLGALMGAIGEGRAASAMGTEAMLDILERQAFNDEIPAGLPAGIPVAHKTGWITGTLHDAALVRPSGRPAFVLVVLTTGIPEQEVARHLIQEIAREVWAFETSSSTGAAR